MPKVIIIGGGICGLSSAMYLAKAGWEVTVLDKNDFADNCSYGNAGFVCPSHYIQLATPGIVKQGFKWMLNNQSPFYIQPRISKSLIGWGWSFIRSANKQNVEKHGIPLRDIGLLSQYEYENVWQKEMDIEYVHKGMLEIFKTEKGKEESASLVAIGQRLELDIELIDREELQALEPHTKVNALGAIHYKCDGHLSPDKLMKALITQLHQLGVKMINNAEVTDIILAQNRIQSIKTKTAAFEADAFVLAAGAWSGILAKKLDLKLPLVGGRGYSVTLPIDSEALNIQHPGLLVEGRCAFSPIENGKIRFGGTMEITSHNVPPRFERVKGILKAVHEFFPEIDISLDEIKDRVWSGFRPISGDGMPYIGRTSKWRNLIVATGHGQLGISLGAATGLLVLELLEGKKTSVDITAFSLERFN
ncbi:NAD(P)/FAD-dependent oxidoreductase [Arachidicoccus soli]|uniref:FAD-binding oxidoreductase n=1 Tax=Arachidicoccus soli TaxID=2341117 RepID=A0A386HP78_9BACT|nr:FAD-dependent oxidoreductase [Arachidicoccus soli]AYD47737.1 FAD-binding oxidoreductase [Arachidicoccus soli]